MLNTPEKWMNEALNEAKKADNINEVPIGAVIVKDSKIIGRGHNTRESTQCATRHAEIIAIEDACKKLNSWRLWECELFVTIEPCLMCSGAIISSQIDKIFFGARDPKAGAVYSLYNTLSDNRLNHQVVVTEKILDRQSEDIIKTFFKKIRKLKK